MRTTTTVGHLLQDKLGKLRRRERLAIKERGEQRLDAVKVALCRVEKLKIHVDELAAGPCIVLVRYLLVGNLRSKFDCVAQRVLALYLWIFVRTATGRRPGIDATLLRIG